MTVVLASFIMMAAFCVRCDFGLTRTAGCLVWPMSVSRGLVHARVWVLSFPSFLFLGDRRVSPTVNAGVVSPAMTPTHLVSPGSLIVVRLLSEFRVRVENGPRRSSRKKNSKLSKSIT